MASPCAHLGSRWKGGAHTYQPGRAQHQHFNGCVLAHSRCDRSFVARWRLSGALKLPNRPRIKPYLGATLYELDDEGLIASHNEEWSITALEAFLSTVWPSLGVPAAPEAGVLQRDESLWRHLQPPEPRLLASADEASEMHSTMSDTP